MLAVAQIPIGLIQTLMLPYPGAVFRQQRQALFIGFAQFLTVLHRVQMAHRRPNPGQSVIRIRQRLAEIFPRERARLGHDFLNGVAAVLKRGFHRRHDVLRTNSGKRGQ
ncbi:hypothetical protein SODG_003110 [Sodalis praecaptivus]